MDTDGSSEDDQQQRTRRGAHQRQAQRSKPATRRARANAGAPARRGSDSEDAAGSDDDELDQQQGGSSSDSDAPRRPVGGRGQQRHQAAARGGSSEPASPGSAPRTRRAQQQQQQQQQQRRRQLGKRQQADADEDSDAPVPSSSDGGSPLPSPRVRRGQQQQQQQQQPQQPPRRPAAAAASPPTCKRRGRPPGASKAPKTGAAAGASAARDATQLLPPGLDEEMLRSAWLKLPPKNRNAKEALMQGYRREFPRWRMQLRQRFSLLFHGFGSKRALLHAFASDALTDGGVLSIRGAAPGVTARAVLAAAAGALAHKGARGAGCEELLAAIQAEPPARRLYILLHNIDGPGLRSPEEQLWLGRLAQCRNIHLVASTDHVNSALLWDARAAARFRWLWVEAPTYAPYEDETRDMPPLLTGCLQSSSKRGAATVLGTLVSAARSVFRVLAEHQLGDPAAGGASQALLFRMCRERFILNSEQALRSHLVEFRDHELVRGTPGPDGGELLYIPLDEDALRQVLDEMDAGGGR